FYAYDISINSLTLLGIALAVGMLLNSSIVVLENIFRHLALKRPIDTAVKSGTAEVWRPLFASTFTTVTVFVPFLFSSDFLIQTIGRHVGISIISTLVISLVVALFLVPMIAHTMITRFKPGHASLFARVSHRNRLYQMYAVLLKSALRFPARTIVGAIVAFFVTLFLCLILSTEVPTQEETDQIQVYITMPSGSTLEATDAAVADIEEWLADIEEIEEVSCTIYEEEANLTLQLYEDFEEMADRSYDEISDQVEDMLDQFRVGDASLSEPMSSARFGSGPGRNTAGQFMRMFGIGSASETITFKGNDFDTLVRVANAVKFQIDQLESLNNESRLSIPGETPELRLLLDNRLLTLYNISPNSIASEMSSTQGEVTASATFKQGTDEYDIVIRSSDYDEEDDEMTTEELREIAIPDQSGAPHAIENLVDFRYASSKSSITRVNQEQEVDLTYSFSSDITDSKTYLEYAREEVDNLVASLSIPTGVAVEVIHDENDLSEFYYLIAAAFILIFMILASVFESITAPVVMMFTIPLAGIGAFWALIVTGNSIYNANSLIGMLILVGIVVNNGIMLIDYARILQSQGFSRARALMASGQARVRPILITAITTIVAMFPLAMGNSGNIGQIGAPFAITVIGGLALSALFTLIFIPTVYTALETSLEWLRGLSRRVQIAQAAAFLFGLYLIYLYVDDVIWQIADVIGLLFIVPGGAYFLLVTLRQARSDIVKPGEPLKIRIRRLVKVYDDYSRFTREWRKGERLQRLVIGKTHKTPRELFSPYRWQIPLLGFQVFFIFFYLESPFWQFMLAHLVYWFLFTMIRPVKTVLNDRAEARGAGESRLAGILHNAVYWGFPALMIVAFHFIGFEFLTLIFIAGFWGLPLLVANTSDRLHHGNVNIMRLKGRFAGIRAKWYQLVTAIPVIGRKKKPFSALNSVSLEIGNGMFGLLGPNGAGKSTIMRTICGVQEQSMGRMYVNDADANEEREELQGLIGYLPQEFGTYENMTAYEFLDYLAILKGITDTAERRERIEYVLSSVHLWDVRDRKIGSYSGGMKQRIGIALTLLHLPRILVVDEPTAGLDPRERIRFRNLLVELSRERIVIFSTHIIEDISSSCNNVAVFNRGTLRYHGNPSAMTAAAEGKVWQFLMDFSDFETRRHELKIVHHIQVGDQIRVRCLAEQSPDQSAIQVKPTLEDAYLWLLGSKPVPNADTPAPQGGAA
ncbi:ATP-binding cassette domain-containing protein, partial [bacterium]|nr:ATP-binding cassette domain-containing protein [bacterium]